MLVAAIGEGFKNIDKLTEGALLPLRPEIHSNVVIIATLRNRSVIAVEEGGGFGL